MNVRTDSDSGDDMVLRAVRMLPRLDLVAHEEARIAMRAKAVFVAAASRRHKFARDVARAARPLVPLSLAGLALGYLVWVCQQITEHLR